MTEIARIVGERIRQYRHTARLSQDELAEKAGMHGTYIGQLERGEKNATLESLERVARALNMPLETFVENISISEDINQTAAEGYNLINSLPHTDQEILLDLMKRTVAYKNM